MHNRWRGSERRRSSFARPSARALENPNALESIAETSAVLDAATPRNAIPAVRRC
jgi:hypothetical protein